MAQVDDIPRVSMQVTRGVVVASIQVDLDESVVGRFREDLLSRVHQTGARGVILDVSGLETLDSEEFDALRRIMTMARLLGAESVLAGLGPGIVSALIELGVEVDDLLAAIDLDAAFDALLPHLASDPESDEALDEEPAESPAPDGDLLPQEAFELEIEP